MPTNQKGSFVPILGLVSLLIVIAAAVYYFRAPGSTVSIEVSNPPQESYPIKSSDTYCKPELREFEGSCTLGQIIVQTKRTLTKAELQQILDKYDLTVLYDWNHEYVALDVMRLDQGLTSAQWDEKLNDSIVLRKEIRDISYTDGIYSGGFILFNESVTDTQIEDYIKKNGIEKAVPPNWVTDHAFTVKVPDGTEMEWREKLMNDSKDITDVRLTFNSFGHSIELKN